MGYTVKRKRTAETTLFHRLLMLSLAAQYLWIVLGQFTLEQYRPWNIEHYALFTALFAVHFLLHGFSRRLCRHTVGIVLYIIVQSGFIYALSLIADSGQMREWLYLPLLGEVLLFADTVWFAIFAASIMFGLDMVQGYIEFGDAYTTQLPGVVVWWAIWWGIGQTPYVSVLLLQVRGRRHALDLLQQLDSAHRELTEYAIRVEKLTLVAERARMARELHDTLAQGLTGTILQLEALEAYLEIGDTAKASTIATRAKKRARAALADSRSAIDDLRIAPPQDTPMNELIQHEIKRVSEATGISYSLDMSPLLALPSSISDQVMRCITEGLSNIVRHAHASHIRLQVFQEADCLQLQLQDNGIGFDPVLIAQLSGHYGILGMRERMRLIGGTFAVQSTPGAGTIIEINIRLDDKG